MLRYWLLQAFVCHLLGLTYREEIHLLQGSLSVSARQEMICMFFSTHIQIYIFTLFPPYCSLDVNNFSKDTPYNLF